MLAASTLTAGITSSNKNTNIVIAKLRLPMCGFLLYSIYSEVESLLSSVRSYEHLKNQAVQNDIFFSRGINM